MTKFGIGQSPARFEDPRLLRGKGCFVDDINQANQAHAYNLLSAFANVHTLSGVYAIPAAHATVNRVMSNINGTAPTFASPSSADTATACWCRKARCPK